MIERVDFFTMVNQYSSTPYFTMQFKNALERQGVSCRVFDLEDGNFREYMQLLLIDPPDLTCSFNYLRYGFRDLWLCDAIRLPHLTYGLDGSAYCLDHFTHPYALLSTVDSREWEGLKSIGGGRAWFMPHAVERDFTTDFYTDRPYDVVFCGTYIDYVEEMASWDSKFTLQVCEMLKMASDSVLNDVSVSMMEALDNARQALKVDTSGFTFHQVYASLETYCKGKDRADLVRALQEFDLHLFGSHQGTMDWRKSFKDAKNITYHAPVSFEESLDIFRKSKIIINSAPQFRHGSHERVFYGLAAGCAVVTNDNPYLKTHFGRDRGVLYYHPTNVESLKEEIKEILSNDALRKMKVSQGLCHVMDYHTWDNRVEEMNSQWNGVHFDSEHELIYT